MAAQRAQESDNDNGARPVPRDLPDQQARPGEDPWEVVPGHPLDEQRDPNIPDTDEAGSGPKGAPRPGTVNPEQPTPQEPPA
ncbi:hypothetical protein [Streptomyces sp. NPDC051452]|uniref:hypothetical protein n=1 Tax=Streptomyces sp. NPDC051452 TaxID=3365654 RepID=UPI00378E577D